MSATLFMPIILDLSNATTALLFGEDYVETASQEPFNYHLKWDINDSNVCKIADMSGILFGDRDSGDGLFYQTTGGISAFTGAISAALKGNFLHQSVACGSAQGNCIPLKDNTSDTDAVAATSFYSGFLATSTAKISIGEALLRVMSTHLLGHPLAQSVIKNDQSFIDGAHTGTDNLITQFTTGLSGGMTAVALTSTDTSNISTFDSSGNPTSASTVTKASGTSNVVLKSMLEQLMSDPNTAGRFTETARPTDMSSLDQSMNTYVHRLPLQANDSIVFYVRARATLGFDTDLLSGSDALDPSGSASSSANDASSITVASIFPGGNSGTTYGWVGHADASGLNTHLTDEQSTNIFDAHIWRVKVTIQS